jgi:hypothetical protein
LREGVRRACACLPGCPPRIQGDAVPLSPLLWCWRATRAECRVSSVAGVDFRICMLSCAPVSTERMTGAVDCSDALCVSRARSPGLRPARLVLAAAPSPHQSCYRPSDPLPPLPALHDAPPPRGPHPRQRARPHQSALWRLQMGMALGRSGHGAGPQWARPHLSALWRLQMGMDPRVIAASAAFMILFTATSTTLQYPTPSRRPNSLGRARTPHRASRQCAASLCKDPRRYRSVRQGRAWAGTSSRAD